LAPELVEHRQCGGRRVLVEHLDGNPGVGDHVLAGSGVGQEGEGSLADGAGEVDKGDRLAMAFDDANDQAGYGKAHLIPRPLWAYLPS